MESRAGGGAGGAGGVEKGAVGGPPQNQHRTSIVRRPNHFIASRTIPTQLRVGPARPIPSAVRTARGARPAFTLLEVVVALVVTAAVVLLAYGTVAAGTDAGERLARADAGARAEIAARTLLHDALRHAEPGVSGDDTAFVLETATDAAGRPADRLRFFSRGVVPPLGAGGRWAVSAAVTPGAGLELLAVPADVPNRAAVRVVVPGVTSVRVRVLARSGGAWEGAWPTVSAVPAAVLLTFADRAGEPVGPPLVARTRP